MQAIDLVLLLSAIYLIENFKTTYKCLKNIILRKKKLKAQKVYKKVKKFENDLNDDDDDIMIEL